MSFTYFIFTIYFIAIVMDNAANCDTLAQYLGLLLWDKYKIHFHPENNRIRCLAHVVNLVVQAILKELDEAEAAELHDYYLDNKDAPLHYDEDEDEDLMAMEAEMDVEVNDVVNIDIDDLPEDSSKFSSVKKVLHSLQCRHVNSPAYFT